MEKVSGSLQIFILLIIITTICIIFSLILFVKIQNMKEQLNEMSEILDDILEGNSNRKILVNPNDITNVICYKMNDIVRDFRKQIGESKKKEETNKQLLTSLSHDMRTPLTTLIGYLDATQKGIVVGEEREGYIETARRRAYDMKYYVDTLFEWFKLNSDEVILAIQEMELGEVTRNILKDWIPVFEASSLDFNIDIPEAFIGVQLDKDAYIRIVNNLIQNVVFHSQATCIELSICCMDEKVRITVSDNGVGISQQDLPHIFERLYKCDKARSEKGSGLGLSIVQQLVEKMSGFITVESSYGKSTEFNIFFPCI